jgi:hypothetical protein
MMNDAYNPIRQFPSDYTLLAAYWADVDLSITGKLYYRVTKGMYKWIWLSVVCMHPLTRSTESDFYCFRHFLAVNSRLYTTCWLRAMHGQPLCFNLSTSRFGPRWDIDYQPRVSVLTMLARWRTAIKINRNGLSEAVRKAVIQPPS